MLQDQHGHAKHRPQFLSDNRRVVFDSALAVVDGTINSVHVDTGTVERIGGGKSVEGVRTGPYRITSSRGDIGTFGAAVRTTTFGW